MGPHSDNLARLDRGNWRWIIAAIVVAVVSLAIVARYFHRAFPEASIDFQVSGPSSAPLAQGFLQAQGLSVAGYQHAEQFGYDDDAKTFLERELGLNATEQAAVQRLQLWRWDHRWFRPQQKEEFSVEVATSGAIASFDHVIADTAPGATLTEEQARDTARRFLAEMHLDSATWIEISADRQVKPHRVDYVFTWKETAELAPSTEGEVAQAEVRHEVTVQGSAIGAYDEYLKVPEAWQRGYAQLRSRNDTTGMVDSGVILIMFVALLFVLVGRFRRGDVRWRTAFWIGGIGALLSFLANLNQWDAARFAYSTTQSWPAFVTSTLFGYGADAVGIGVFLLVLTAAAESLYRERFPGHLAVPGLLHWRGVRSKTFFMSMVLGLGLAALFFAYQTVFYLIANHFGAWAPADVPYDDLLNTRLPWAFVLFSGFFPAISEEFGFRMFAIPLFEKWFKYLWVAILAASFAWGFGHATYPNQPFYIRGVEVGLGGILLSWVMIRFGILTTVVWHYTVDALYTAMLLLRAHDGYLRWSGAGSALLAVAPLVVALAAYKVHGGFVPEHDQTNAALGSAPVPAPVTAADDAGVAVAPYEPIPGPHWTVALLVGIALLATFAVRLRSWDSVLPWRVNAAQAEDAARAFLSGQGLDISGYRATAVLESAAGSSHGEENLIAGNDILARHGPRELQTAFSGAQPTVMAARWSVRFFKVLQNEEFDLAVRPDNGQVVAYSHTLPETAPGGAPTLTVAQQTAAAFLASRGIPVAGMALKQAQQQKRIARTDSTFVWEQTAAPPVEFVPGEVAYRVEADLSGDHVSYFDAWYHEPDSRVRAYEATTLASIVLLALKGVLLALVAALFVYWILRFARDPHSQWRPLLKLSVLAGLVFLAAAVVAAPLTLASYPTEISWQAFVVQEVISCLVQGLGGFLVTLGLAAAVVGIAPVTAAFTVANLRRRLERESAWDALWVGVLALAWTVGFDRLRAVIAARWYAGAFAIFPLPDAGLAQWLPGAGDVLGAALHTLWMACFAGVILVALGRAFRSVHWRWAAIAATGLLWVGLVPSSHSPAQLAQAAAISAVTLGLIFAFAHLLLRASPLAWCSALLLPALVQPALGWLALDTSGAKLIAGGLVAVAVAWLLWLAWMSRPGRMPANAGHP